MVDELKPCPFCGSGYIDTGCLTVGCCRCGANGPEGYEGVTETWNSRPIEDALRAEVARLRELLRDLAGTEEEGDLISGHVVMSKKEVATIRAEVERLKAENQQMHHDWMADHAEMEHLKDELAKRSAPLTNDQARMVALMRGESSPAISFYQGVDSAIRAARSIS